MDNLQKQTILSVALIHKCITFSVVVSQSFPQFEHALLLLLQKLYIIYIKDVPGGSYEIYDHPIHILKTLNDVSRAISTKTTIPILTGLKIVLNDSGLILTGSDADISIESRINATDENNDLQIGSTGEIVLPARFFSEIVKRLPESTMTLKLKTISKPSSRLGHLNLLLMVWMPITIRGCQKLQPMQR